MSKHPVSNGTDLKKIDMTLNSGKYAKLLGEITSLPLEDKEALIEDVRGMIEVETEALPYERTPIDELTDSESAKLKEDR